MLRWAEVHLDRLLLNYRTVKELCRKQVYAVVKANAYGHGSREVSTFLEENTDVYGFAVATYEEGACLREAGVKRPILVMSSTLEEGRGFLKEYELTPVVYDFGELSLAKELKVPFHLKVDTGMGRLGFLEGEWEELLSRLKNLPVVGVMTHFSSADEDREFTLRQLEKFESFVSRLKREFPGLEVHAENSAAVLYRFNRLLTHCRVGLALYGVPPEEGYPELSQVMEVKAKVLTVKELPPNYPVSYSKTYRTKERERVAVISFGYADGYPRELSNRGEVLINGKRCPVRGRVCMDMTVVSVEGLSVEKGDVATLYGEGITFKSVSGKLGKIPYELMCSISPRVERVYFGLQKCNAESSAGTV